MVLTQGLYTFIECTNCREFISSSMPREDFKRESAEKGWKLGTNITLCPKCVSINVKKSKT